MKIWADAGLNFFSRLAMMLLRCRNKVFVVLPTVI